MIDECCMKDGYITPPEDRTYHDKQVRYTLYRPNGWFLVYDNNTFEFKVEGSHVLCVADHLLDILRISSDLDTLVTCIMNTDEPDRQILIDHLNHEAQYWDGD